MSDGIGCLFAAVALAVVVFAFAALGFCGPEAAQNAREILGR